MSLLHPFKCNIPRFNYNFERFGFKIREWIPWGGRDGWWKVILAKDRLLTRREYLDIEAFIIPLTRAMMLG